MLLELSRAREILERTPGVVRAMLGGLNEAWVQSNYGPETFSPFDVVGHLIHGEKTDWMVRVRHILRNGEALPFEPFDRYAMYAASRGKRLDELLAEFARLRDENLRELHSLNLSESNLKLAGAHPALGRVTLRQLLATWVAHDLNHVHQIAKCMAIQYRDECGPWAEYMGVYR